MSFDAQVELYTVIIFLLLLAVLWRFAWRPLMKALEEREQRIAKRIGDAAELHRVAEASLREQERRIATAEDDAAAIIALGKLGAEKVREETMAAAVADRAKTMDRVKREIQLTKEAAVHELREQMVQLAGELASQVIMRELKLEDHRRLIEEAMTEVEKAFGQELAKPRTPPK